MPTDPTASPEARADDGSAGDDVRDSVAPQMPSQDAADVAVDAVDELAEQGAEIGRLQDENEQLKAQLKDLQDQRLRDRADYDNSRRRLTQQQALNETRARDAVVLPFLSVYDDLRRSLDAARRQEKQDGEGASPAFGALAEGVELVYKKFGDTLAKLGVERIESVGQPFSEDLHEAMMQQPAPDADTEPGTVLAEIQPGYRVGDRVLRHAQVIVAQ